MNSGGRLEDIEDMTCEMVEDVVRFFVVVSVDIDVGTGILAPLHEHLTRILSGFDVDFFLGGMARYAQL